MPHPIHIIKNNCATYAHLPQLNKTASTVNILQVHAKGKKLIFQEEPSRVLLHQRPRGAFLGVGGLAGQAASAGPMTGSCCCSCKSDISSSRKLGGQVPSNCLSAPRQLRYTVCGCPQTAPLHCLSATTETATLHCTSASRQLLCSVCRCPQTAPLHYLLVGM